MKSTTGSGARFSSGSHSGASTRSHFPRIGFCGTATTSRGRCDRTRRGSAVSEKPCCRGRDILPPGPRKKEEMMGKIVITEFISVDGVIEDPGGSEDFKYGGWAFEFSRGDEGDKFKLDETLRSDALLPGRATYEGFADAWPQREGEFADKFNNMPKYVVSSTLSDPAWTNSTVVEGDLEQAVAKLRDEHDGDIVVHGSARLAQALIDKDLVDELRLMVYPVVLGAGKRLFGETSDKKTLKLVESQPVGDGVMILVYGRA